MYIVVASTEDKPAIFVADPDDCGRLHLRSEVDPAALADALDAASLGTLGSGDIAFIHTASLRRLAEREAVADDWDDRWHNMLRYAAAHGWLRDDKTMVEVHCEYRPSEVRSRQRP